MHAKKKNMAAITAYLMSRKAQGRPLTASEDQQLQKFYYNRSLAIRLLFAQYPLLSPHYSLTIFALLPTFVDD